MVDVQLLHDVFRRFAVTMTQPFEISQVLYELGDSAVSVMDADGAGLSIATSDGCLEFVTATDRDLVHIGEVQEELQAGPSVEAFRHGEPVVIEDIAEMTSWKPYCQAAADANLAAVVGMPIKVAEHRIGSLDIYHRKTRQWSSDEVDAVRALAEIAAAYIVRAGEHADAVTLAGQLQRALDSRIIIEQAKGVLSRHHDIPVGDAFDLLRSYARSNNRHVRDVAHAIVNDGLDIS